VPAEDIAAAFRPLRAAAAGADAEAGGEGADEAGGEQVQRSGGGVSGSSIAGRQAAWARLASSNAHASATASSGASSSSSSSSSSSPPSGGGGGAGGQSSPAGAEEEEEEEYEDVIRERRKQAAAVVVQALGQCFRPIARAFVVSDRQGQKAGGAPPTPTVRQAFPTFEIHFY
jgi:hypothetical protein